MDGRVGFTGSQNMIDKTYLVQKNLKKGLYYQELMACVRGPVVYQLDAAFRTDWYSETNVMLDRQSAPESAFTPVMEVTLVVYDRQVVADFEPIYALYIERARPLRLNEWQARPALQKFYDNTTRLTAALQ